MCTGYVFIFLSQFTTKAATDRPTGDLDVPRTLGRGGGGGVVLVWDTRRQKRAVIPNHEAYRWLWSVIFFDRYANGIFWLGHYERTPKDIALRSVEFVSLRPWSWWCWSFHRWFQVLSFPCRDTLCYGDYSWVSVGVSIVGFRSMVFHVGIHCAVEIILGFRSLVFHVGIHCAMEIILGFRLSFHRWFQAYGFPCRYTLCYGDYSWLPLEFPSLVSGLWFSMSGYIVLWRLFLVSVGVSIVGFRSLVFHVGIHCAVEIILGFRWSWFQVFGFPCRDTLCYGDYSWFPLEFLSLVSGLWFSMWGYIVLLEIILGFRWSFHRWFQVFGFPCRNTLCYRDYSWCPFVCHLDKLRSINTTMSCMRFALVTNTYHSWEARMRRANPSKRQVSVACSSLWKCFPIYIGICLRRWIQKFKKHAFIQ